MLNPVYCHIQYLLIVLLNIPIDSCVLIVCRRSLWWRFFFGASTANHCPLLPHGDPRLNKYVL